VQFSVAAPVRRAVLTAPAAHVPRYQHVFLFYFENEDYTDVIGKTRQAPFINSLLPHASVLADFFAEEHPSDGNYLALAGGSTFGIPLDDPLEENSQYTIRAPNIGDLIDTAHETWKAYLQSADGPCDDTVHGYYWDDDMPMTYFADVRERPAYCSQHLVPLQSLQTDLASAATTPNFAWVSPNDCTDMEGCGIRSGDDFLKAELGQIMRSPAWRHQRSLAIITFDEDATDNQHPAQRVPTIVIGSAGVRPGYVSRVRYTHYSLLRTIEAALGLGTLTPNDKYAQPVNDVFRQGEADVWTQSAPVPAVVSRVRASQVPAGASVPAAGHGPADQTAFVVNSASNSVTPVNLVTRRAGKPVPVGSEPQAIALSPDGGTAYVVNSGSGTVTPINTATRRAGPAIRVGAGPQAIAITPDGRTAYVLDWGGGSVTPVRIASSRAGPPVRVGSYPFAISVAPDGRVAYVASYGSDTVTAIDAVTGRKAGPPVSAGQAPDALAVTPDSRAVYAVGGDSDTVTEISAATGGAGQPVPVGYSPTAVAISRSGRWALVVNTISGTVTPVGVATGRAASPISVGAYSYPTAIALAASGPLAVVVDTYSGQVTLINTSTLKSAGTVTVGNYPVAAVIAP
jgi:YVTN family beta-propeller protein